MLSWIGTVRGTAACHPSPQLVCSDVEQVRVRVRGRGRGRFTVSAAVATATTLPLMQFLYRGGLKTMASTFSDQKLVAPVAQLVASKPSTLFMLLSRVRISVQSQTVGV